MNELDKIWEIHKNSVTLVPLFENENKDLVSSYDLLCSSVFSIVSEPDHMLDLNHLTVARASPNIGHNSRHHSLPRLGSHSDSDTSPRGTPELGRKHLKSISAQAKRSVRFVENQLLICYLTLSWRRFLSSRNQPIDLHNKSLDWFLHDRDLRRERLNPFHVNFSSLDSFWYYIALYRNQFIDLHYKSISQNVLFPII